MIMEENNSTYKCPECSSEDPYQPNGGAISTCESCADKRRCEPALVETKEELVQIKVQVSYHKFEPEMHYYTARETLAEVIAAWSFGTPRPGAHYWDESSCHVAFNPETKEYLLLYI